MSSINNIKPEYRVMSYPSRHNGKTFGAIISRAAEAQKNKGNDFLQLNELDMAISCYKKAIELSPDYADAYFNLGKAYHLAKKYTEAIEAFEKTKSLTPNDTETLILLGECYSSIGRYPKAIESFQAALTTDPASDYAKRNLEETKNYQLAVFNPKLAYEQKKAQAQKNLNEAVKMVQDFLPKGYMKDLADVSIVFDTTEAMGGRSNIAQYEHAKRKITITGDYIWANPRLVGAYIRHEFVHAKDNDPYTSIREEQDAYEEAAKFWQSKHNEKGVLVKDPEMDYVIELYEQSPQALKTRVAEIYSIRDRDIARTSPNHPPSTANAAASALNDDDLGSQPLKHYNVIA